MSNTIKVELFKKNGDFQRESIDGGVYCISLSLVSDREKQITLYVGESGSMLHRCSRHLCRIFENAEYMGLDKEDLERQDLVLMFSVLEKLTDKKIREIRTYLDTEKYYIEKLKPLTQLESSDRQRKDKYRCVQDAMKAKGFK